MSSIIDAITRDDLFDAEHGNAFIQYDALIVYSEATIPDINFAMEVIEEMEIRGRLRICRMDQMLHGNPFDNADTLRRLMDRCNHVLVVVTNNFVCHPLLVQVSAYAMSLEPKQRQLKFVSCAEYAMTYLPPMYTVGGLPIVDYHFAHDKGAFWRNLRTALYNEVPPHRQQQYRYRIAKTPPEPMSSRDDDDDDADNEDTNADTSASGRTDRTSMSSDSFVLYDVAEGVAAARHLEHRVAYDSIASLASSIDFQPIRRNVSTPNGWEALSLDEAYVESDSDDANVQDSGVMCDTVHLLRFTVATLPAWVCTERGVGCFVLRALPEGPLGRIAEEDEDDDDSYYYDYEEDDDYEDDDEDDMEAEDELNMTQKVYIDPPVTVYKLKETNIMDDVNTIRRYSSIGSMLVGRRDGVEPEKKRKHTSWRWMSWCCGGAAN